MSQMSKYNELTEAKNIAAASIKELANRIISRRAKDGTSYFVGGERKKWDQVNAEYDRLKLQCDKEQERILKRLRPRIKEIQKKLRGKIG